MRSHKHSFTVALTFISRILIFRDRIWQMIVPGLHETAPNASASQHAIPSTDNLLDAVFVEPAGGPAQAAVLICHGIGETVEHWLPVQQLLASHGVASLVFDYSGYGRSTGRIEWSQFEQDALSAFQYLQRLTLPLPISILGFSLGSGPAAAIVSRVAVDRLILCAAFTSFRAAVRSLGLPRGLAFLVPPIWSVKDSLCNCRIPVLVVHGEKDRLFPLQMARDLASLCPTHVELVVVPNLGHSEPYRKPDLSYWGPIICRLVSEEPARIRS